MTKFLEEDGVSYYRKESSIMKNLQKGMVTITTSLTEDFGYGYNTDILTYIKEDSKKLLFYGQRD